MSAQSSVELELILSGYLPVLLAKLLRGIYVLFDVEKELNRCSGQLLALIDGLVYCYSIETLSLLMVVLLLGSFIVFMKPFFLSSQPMVISLFMMVHQPTEPILYGIGINVME